MNVLITGGAGFIGSHLAEELLRPAAEVRVRVADSFVTGRRENLAAIAGRVELLEGDLLDQGLRTRALEGIETVFHLAAIPSIPRSVQDPASTHLNGALLNNTL